MVLNTDSILCSIQTAKLENLGESRTHLNKFSNWPQQWIAFNGTDYASCHHYAVIFHK